MLLATVVQSSVATRPVPLALPVATIGLTWGTPVNDVASADAPSAGPLRETETVFAPGGGAGSTQSSRSSRPVVAQPGQRATTSVNAAPPYVMPVTVGGGPVLSTRAATETKSTGWLPVIVWVQVKLIAELPTLPLVASKAIPPEHTPPAKQVPVAQVPLQVPPQLSEAPQVAPAQVGVQQLIPWQTSFPGQAAVQVPLQPSLPPPQRPVHWGMQQLPATQLAPPGQVVQVPPQPSDLPQSAAPQVGPQQACWKQT